MGGGHSSPSSVQNNDINISGTYSGDSVTTYSNIHTGPATNDQTASSTGATVGITAGVTVPVGIILQNLITWDQIKKDVKKYG